MERLGTGNRQLDEILGGGFPASSIHIIMGSPGTGKTILAEQLAFANGTKERPALYLTTVSEPLLKFLAYLQEYAFGDTSRVGSEIIYESIGEELTLHPDRFTAVVTDLVKRHRPGVLVVDSFKAAGDLMPDLATWRRQLHMLAGTLSAYRMTSFWIGEYVAEMKSVLPEFAVADGVLDLVRTQRGSRDFRSLRVVKLRGSDFLDGDHAFRITRTGLDVFPRLRTPVTTAAYAAENERIASGIPGLDAMIATGWLRGSTTILIGPSGSGKTLLSLQFAREGAIHGEPALFVSFEENPVQLARVVGSLGWDARGLLRPGKIDLFFASPVELQIDTIVRELFGRIEGEGIRRVVLDGLGDLGYTADDPVRFRDYLFAMTQQFAARNVTAMMTLQSPWAQSGANGVTYLGDNVILMEVGAGNELQRTLRVLKTRGSAHDGRRRPIAIRSGGMEVG